MESLVKTDHCFLRFRDSINDIPQPVKFTYPFNHKVHPLCLKAASELQEYLRKQNNFDHNFGLQGDDTDDELGKMFGVMIVKNNEEEIGYLAAFSGKLAGENHHQYFVPPVFDILKDGGFFRLGEEEVNKINRKIALLENSEDFMTNCNVLLNETARSKAEISAMKKVIKAEKLDRDLRRRPGHESMSDADRINLNDTLDKESAASYYRLKDLKRYWKRRLAEIHQMINQQLDEISKLKEERKNKSASLQQRVFEHYHFLNQNGEQKTLHEIFTLGRGIVPPAGAGECAAPKLLQYAFMHRLQPIAMAEFWWGKAPSSEIRRHEQFYPACRGKCEPILTHMLEGMEVDEDPMLDNPRANMVLEIIYEDEYIVAVNKPEGMLTVPGKKVVDSVYMRMKELYPEATGPMIVHRLDQATSGILLISKTKAIHQHLQNQFSKRKIKKKYVALLDGVMTMDSGNINLPIRVDLDDRPRQMVCYHHGKPSETNWVLVEQKGNVCRVHFYPVTGRTHQLRVHASHPSGLNAPIVGDDLYGRRADRLYLHAEEIQFVHPVTNEVMVLKVAAEF